MRKVLTLAMLLCLISGSIVSGAENTKGKKSGKKDTSAKNDAPAGKEETLTGMMAIKPAGAGEDVVGVIVAKRPGEAEKAFKVVASGDLAKQIETLRKNGTRMKITGTINDDVIKATKAEEGGGKYKK